MSNLITVARTGGMVKRYHCVRTIGQDTIATHSYGVVIFVLALCPDPSLNLMKAALFHDLAEQVTGDSPAMAKWGNNGLEEVLNKMEIEFNVYHELYVPLSPKENLILSYADVLELCFFCLEELQLGNKYVIPVFRAGLKRLKSLAFLDSAEGYVRELEVMSYGLK